MLPLLLAVTISTSAGIPSLVNGYLDRYFQTFPTRATEAGRHDFDLALEDLSPANRAAWVRFNRDTREALATAMRQPGVATDDRIDAEMLVAEIDRELHDWTVLKRPERNPLFWTGLMANATVFLLVRDDLPLPERLARAAARARLLPRLAGQAQDALAATPPALIAPELCRIAAGQAQAAAAFYRDGFPRAGGGDAAALRAAGATAADGLARLATFLNALAARATGDPRLGHDYADTFRLGTRVTEPVEAVLARAEADLAAKRQEAAAYGRSVWSTVMNGQPMPSGDAPLLRALFDRVARDRDTNLDEYVANWNRNVRELDRFVHERRLMTLPDPLTLTVRRSPSYFVGQSVGGVYAAGPYAPEGQTLLFLPVPPDSASAAERDAFYRDFNRNFNRMIAAHELIPGHYVQLKVAARQPRKVRAVFPDPVYVEGWGTFCERAMLDEGWAGPLPRLAHLKKQLENISRAIVDIRVHTGRMSRDEVIRFVEDEALQDDQFARNMWTRAITDSPQLTFYYLGYREVMDVYEAARTAQGAAFTLRGFLDGMMAMGPVPLRYYKARFEAAR